MCSIKTSAHNMPVGHTVRRCPQPEDSGENDYGGDDAAGYGGSYGRDNTQQEQGAWTDTNEVTDQFAQLKTDNAENDAQW